jgi:Protein of unknown function (DUF3892)
MTMRIRITNVSKPSGYNLNPHEAISELQWTVDSTGQTGRSTREQIYNWLKNAENSAYVRDRANDVAFVGTRENAKGTRYLQTYADGIWKDNLLSLPNCV